MKIKNFIISISLITLLSCNDNIENIGSSDAKVLTRAIIDGNNSSTTNPELLNNWENVTNIVLGTKTGDVSETAIAPWITGASSYLSDTFVKDIKKEDGWRMLFHTFSKEGQDTKQNYMCFYNMFTGFVKVFYYYNGENLSQNLNWEISASKNKKILDKPSYFSKLESDAADNNKLIITNMAENPSGGLDVGWNGFEFQVPRYCNDIESMNFKIGAYQNVITTYNLLGKFEASTIGTITTESEGTSKVSGTIANIAGAGAKNLIDKFANNNLQGKVFLGKKITNLIGSITTGNYASIIKNGLSMIFGKTTTTTTSEVNLTTTGKATIEGKSSTILTAGIAPVSFNLYDELNTINDLGSNNGIGVWTLKKKPIVYYNRLSHLYNVKRNGTYSSSSRMQIDGDLDYPRILHYEIEPVINPDILPYLTKKEFSVNFVVCDKLDGETYKNGIKDVHEAFGRDTLYADSTRFLSATDAVKHVSFLVPKLNNNKIGNYYYDWGCVTNGRLLAVITLNMAYDYNGKQKEVSLSQVYEVDYAIDEDQVQPESVHNKSNSWVVNYGYPYYSEYSKSAGDVLDLNFYEILYE